MTGMVPRSFRTPPWLPTGSTQPFGLGSPPRALLVLFVLLAGCTGPASQPAGSAPAGASSIAFDDATCAIEGWITDESFLPVPAAEVSLLETDFASRTDGDGRFVFSLVPAGDYRLVAAALGHEPSDRAVSCRAGLVEQPRLILLRTPIPEDPYAATFLFKGKYGCGFAFFIQTTGDFCAPGGALNSPGVIQDAQNSFKIPADVGPVVTTALYEARWQRNGFFGAEYMAFSYPEPRYPSDHPRTPCPDTVPHRTVSKAYGKSVMCVRVDEKNATIPVYDLSEKIPDRFQLVVFPAMNTDELIDLSHIGTGNLQNATTWKDRSSKLVIDQPFEAAATFYYNGEAAPKGFSAFE